MTLVTEHTGKGDWFWWETGEILTKGVAIKLGQHCLKSVKLLNAPWMRPTLTFKIGSQVLSYSLLESSTNTHQPSEIPTFISLPVVCKHSLCRKMHPTIFPQSLRHWEHLASSSSAPLTCGQFDTGPDAKGQSSRRSSSSEVGSSVLKLLAFSWTNTRLQGSRSWCPLPSHIPKRYTCGLGVSFHFHFVNDFIILLKHNILQFVQFNLSPPKSFQLKTTATHHSNCNICQFQNILCSFIA